MRDEEGGRHSADAVTWAPERAVRSSATHTAATSLCRAPTAVIDRCADSFTHPRTAQHITYTHINYGQQHDTRADAIRDPRRTVRQSAAVSALCAALCR